MATGNKIDVYSNLSEPHYEHQNWTENEDTYIEMSGGLMDTLQKSSSLKRSEEHSATARFSSSLADGYIDLDTLRRQKKAKEDAEKDNGPKMRPGVSNARLLSAVFVVIIVSTLVSVAVSVGTHVLFTRIFDLQSPSTDLTTGGLNCSAKVASKCSLSLANNDTYNCTTEKVKTEDTFVTTTGIQCIQLDGFELSLPVGTSLIYDEESHEARCYCTAVNDSKNNFTFSLVCGIWVSQCFSQ